MARNVLARTYPGSKATAWCHAAPALSRLPVSSSAIASRSQASALRESSARARRIARSTGPRVVGSTSSEAHARLSHASTLVLSSWSARSLALISRVSKLSGGTPRTGNPHRLALCSTAASPAQPGANVERSEEHTSELQSRLHLVCRLLL